MQYQYQFTERYEYVKTIEFENSRPLHIERIRFFKEDGVSGTFTKKEFRYSWDRIAWSNWNTLTQGNLSSIDFKDRPDFYLQVKYSRDRISDGNILRWYLFYDGLKPTLPSPTPVLVNADTLWGMPAPFYLDRANQTGSYRDLRMLNVPDGGDPGVFSHKQDTSAGTDFFFKRIRGRSGIDVYEDSQGKIVIDGSAATGDVIYENEDPVVAPVGGIAAGETFFVGGKNFAQTMEAIFYPDEPPSAISINGGVWITDISATGSGNVGDKTFSSDGNVLDYCLADTSSLTVSILALPGHTNYKPVVEINGNPVTLSADSDKPLWRGTYEIQYDFADASITVVHEDGATWSTLVEGDTPPAILSAEFTGGYPGSQTELKASFDGTYLNPAYPADTFDVSVMTDVSISQVIVDDYGAATGGTYNVNGNNVGFTINIADRGNSTQALGLRLRVVKSTGSTSADYLTEDQGSVDGKDLVNLNNSSPIITIGNINYPVGQQAIKSGESATVNHTVTNFDTVSYTSLTGSAIQLAISNPSTYEPAKNVDYLSGNYNVGPWNFTVTANRAANDATRVWGTVVFIAAEAPTLSVSHAPAFRSGGNDGTSEQNHTITITSNQRLLAAPTLDKDTAGNWLGGGFTWSAFSTSFTRSLEVDDNMTKGTFNWGAISGTGLAGLTQTVNSGTTQYTLRGFVQRTITVDAFATSAQINVAIVDYSKVSSSGSGQTLEWSVLPGGLTVRSTLGDTTGGQANTWSAENTGINPTTIYILDTEAAGSSSQASSFTIQEGL